jgi:flagellar assembly factor FliW
MQIETTRFGKVEFDKTDVIAFDNGLIGMESCCRWVLLADADNSLLGWLQSLDYADVALAVVSPRRFVNDYHVRVRARDLEPLKLPTPEAAQILVIVSKSGSSLALNLKAPVVINLEQRAGRQIVAKDDHAVQHLVKATLPLRRTA